MSTLHTITKSWHDATWLYEQLAFAAQGDCIVLMQDAVLAAHSSISLASFLAKCQASQITVLLLEEDCRLRGVDNKYSSIKLIDYFGLVECVAEHSKQVAW